MNTIAKLASTAALTASTSALAGSVYTFQSDGGGFDTKTVFYDDGAEVVAFDAQFTPALAEQALAFLKTQTASPVKYLVITHPNPDKFNGLEVFQRAGAQVIASEATAAAMGGVHAYKKYFFVQIAKMFTEATYPALGKVDRTFRGHLTLELAKGARIELSELGAPGVSVTQTVASIPAAKALVVGDLVHHEAHAWLEGGIVDGKPTPSIAGWIQDLNELRARFGASDPVVLGGRGRAAALSVAVPAQIAYLEAADRIVGDYVAALGARRSELNGDLAAGHFAALQKALEAAFPGYALGYMIKYGVYGLALAK